MLSHTTELDMHENLTAIWLLQESNSTCSLRDFILIRHNKPWRSRIKWGYLLTALCIVKKIQAVWERSGGGVFLFAYSVWGFSGLSDESGGSLHTLTVPVTLWGSVMCQKTGSWRWMCLLVSSCLTQQCVYCPARLATSSDDYFW